MFSQDDELRSKVDRVKEIKFVSPYARYLAILPLAEKQRLADQARKDLEDSKKKLCPDKVAPEDQKFVSLSVLSIQNYLLIVFLFLLGRSSNPNRRRPSQHPTTSKTICHSKTLENVAGNCLRLNRPPLRSRPPSDNGSILTFAIHRNQRRRLQVLRMMGKVRRHRPTLTISSANRRNLPSR